MSNAEVTGDTNRGERPVPYTLSRAEKSLYTIIILLTVIGSLVAASVSPEIRSFITLHP